jgi:hypothetical protein
MLDRRFLAPMLALCSLVWAAPAQAADEYLQAAGPQGLGYVGMYYGLADTSGNWYAASDLLGFDISTSDLAIVDTGSSACTLGRTSIDAYAAYSPPGIPLQSGVTFNDVGFGGTAAFDVTQPVQLMLSGMKTAAPDPENHSYFTNCGPVGRTPPSVTLAVAREPIGGGEIDFDLIGQSVLQGRVLHVDPHELDFIRLTLMAMAGTLDDPAPAKNTPGALFIPFTMQSAFTTPQPVDVGQHPMLPMHLRHAASDSYATGTALFDTGSPVNFVSESLAAAAGIDLNSSPDLTVPVGGVGSQSSERPGWYVDALALDLGNGREGDKLVISNSAVFVIPDADMPAGLSAILGNCAFSPSSDLEDTTLSDWYVDQRAEGGYIILMVPEPASLTLLLAGALALRRRRAIESL